MEIVDLFFEESGSGTPMIFLHGYPLDHTIWKPLIPYLTGEVRLILPDLRGHGNSVVPAGIYSMELMAEDILSLINKLGLKKVILVGHSMGGYASLAFARDRADRLAGLVLVASQCFLDSPDKMQGRLEDAIRVETSRDTSFIADNMLPNLSADPHILNQLRGMIANMNPAGVAGTLRGMAQRSATCGVLADLVVPAVIIAGEQDKIIPLEKARQMAELMRKPWLEVIPGSGHMPMLENPKRVAEILLRIIEKP